jgi:hypothetical protein
VYASRKFCFFLDRHGNGRVRLKDLIQSDVLMEFNKLQFLDLPEDAERTNWFSVPCVSVIHDDWTALDVDESGLLDETELAKYGHGGFTKPFITRVFQYCQTYSGEIDYKVRLAACCLPCTTSAISVYQGPRPSYTVLVAWEKGRPYLAAFPTLVAPHARTHARGACA